MDVALVMLANSGPIAVGVTLNPVIAGALTGTGIVLKTASKFKNYSKIEVWHMAWTTYQKILTVIRSFLRGIGWGESSQH